MSLKGEAEEVKEISADGGQAIDQDDLDMGEIVEIDPDDDEEDIARGTAFEKVVQYDKFLNEPNPWHPDLLAKLFPSQIIGFRWMIDRHSQGGGLIADEVGCGKVRLPFSPS